MKKIFSILIALSFLNLSQNISANIFLKNGFSLFCSSIEILCALNPLLSGYFIHHPNLLAEKQKEHFSNAPQKIIDFVHTQAQERKLKDTIHISVEENGHHSYSADSTKNTIFLSPIVAQELEKLLEKKDLNLFTPTDQTTLNGHIAAIHHEITHLENDDSLYGHLYENAIGATSSAIIFYGINNLVSKHIPYINNNFALQNLIKIPRGIMRVELARYIINSNLHEKYRELRADDGIPNKKELLQAMADEYLIAHKESLQAINNIKSASWKQILNRSKEDKAILNTLQISIAKVLPTKWFNYPLIMDLICHTRFTHPSDVRRAQRLRERIAKIDNEIVQ